MLKRLLRRAYQLLVKPDKSNYKPGISALVCCKDEEHNILPCLQSLSEFVDQIICVDNGSEDSTMQIMLEFQKNNTAINIEVIDAAGKLLKDARNMGLKKAKHQWLLNSGGDFVFYTKPDSNFQQRLQEILRTNTFSAWQFRFVNLYGDLHHTYKTMETSPIGEHYFLRMSEQLSFVEKGKFDYLQFPWYYFRKVIAEPCFFHLDGMKSDRRLLYRNAYFEWRLMINTAEESLRPALKDFERFFELWQKSLFDTNDQKNSNTVFRNSLQGCISKDTTRMSFFNILRKLKRLLVKEMNVSKFNTKMEIQYLGLIITTNL